MSQVKRYEPHQHRVIEERHSLAEKLAKLKDFFESPVFHGLHEVDQELLKDQSIHMQAYLGCLDARIERF
jgi:hypothetical protein